ncbi:MAG: hypothetical protein ACE5GW_12425, partial [Planctomycetota bacterium]
MKALRQFLRARRKAELQTIHQFWFPGESMLTTREELESRVADVLEGGIQVEERVARLSRTQRTLLKALLACPGFQGQGAQLVDLAEGGGAARVEAENALRMLVERGFLQKTRAATNRRGGGRDSLQVPEALARRLAEV